MGIFKPQALYKFVGRLSKREKIVFYAAMSFASLALSDRLMVVPVYSRIQSLNEEIREKEASIKKNLHILAQKDRISSEITRYGSFLSGAGVEEEATSLLKEIEVLANDAGVYLVDMKPAGLMSGGDSRKYLIVLNCESQMEQLSDFMYNVESSNSLLTIEKYQISPKSKESSVIRCNMSIVKMIIPEDDNGG